MASKASKKAKVKPSRQAPTALLWGLDPSSEGEVANKGDAVRAVLRAMGVRTRTVEAERLGDAAGRLAGLHGFVPAPPYAGPVPDCEFVLLCGFTNAQVDEFIARSRAAGCMVGAKALLTPVNKSWSFARLIEAVSAEHAAMTNS